MSSGEVLTTDEAAARVEAEEREKREKLEERAEKQRVAAEKKVERQQIAAKKAADVAARKKIQAARKRVTIQRKAVPKRPNRQQGTLNGSGTLDAYLGLRNNQSTERSHGSEPVSSPSESEDEDGGVPQNAPVRQVKVQPPRKGAQKGEGYYVEQATIDNSDVDDPKPAFTDIDEVSINDYVIYEYKGTCFPGRVFKKWSKSFRLDVHAMSKHKSPPSSWKWSALPNKHAISLNAVKEKIKTPLPLVYGHTEIIIEQMAKYGW